MPRFILCVSLLVRTCQKVGKDTITLNWVTCEVGRVIGCTVKFRVYVRCSNWEKRGRSKGGEKGAVLYFFIFL